MSIQFIEKYVAPVQHKMWTQEYAPKELKSIIGNQMVVETLDSYLTSGHLPNLLLCGPSGSGKTTVAKQLVRQYLGLNYEQYNIEVIGSIYRGKNVVSEKNMKKSSSDTSNDSPRIMNFIRKKLCIPQNRCRIVTIYDFDCMTTEAQMALLRIIEIHVNKVRFIFICENLNGIIEPIQSRTLILNFHRIPMDDIIMRLKEISFDKQLSIDDNIYQTIAIISNGDLKQAINCLQVISNSPNKKITNFYHIFNIPSIDTINQLICHCLSHRSKEAFQVIYQLLDSGYNVTDIFDIIIKVLIYHRNISDVDRTFLIETTIKVIMMNEQTPSVIHLYRLVVNLLGEPR